MRDTRTLVLLTCIMLLSLLLLACIDNGIVIEESDPTPTPDVRFEGTKTIMQHADRHKCQEDNPFSECYEGD